MTTRTAVLALCAAVALPPASTLNAQGVGGRLRQKVAEVAGKDEQQAQQQPVRFDSLVVEITVAAIKGFENGLDVEIQLLTEFATLLETYKTEEEYRACLNPLAGTPEFMKILEQMGNVRDGATMEEMQRVTEKFNKDMAALVLKACGPNPADWPYDKRREKVEEIGRKAAAAAGPVREFDLLPPGGPSVLDDEAYLGSVTQQQGLPYNTYVVMKERIEAYCRYMDLERADALERGVEPDSKAGWRVVFAAILINPAVSPSIYWQFEPAETRVIDPLCPRLVLKIGKATIEQEALTMSPIYIRGRRKK